jgi:hypothetical protein
VWCTLALTWHAQPEADDRALIDDIRVGCDGAIKDTGDEQGDLAAILVLYCCRVPGAIDVVTRPPLNNLSQAVQDDQATGFRVGEFAIGGRQAPDDHPAAFEFDERGRQADAVGTGTGVKLCEDALGAIRRNLEDGAASALQVGVIVEVANENAALIQVADAFLHDGSLSVNDELLIDLYSLQAPAAGKSYYGWLLANRSDLKMEVIPLGKLPFYQGKISYLYKDPTHQNLLLTSSYFLITEEDTHGTPLTPTPDRTEWRYSAEISQVPNSSDTPHQYSLFDHIQHLLAKDPILESIGLRGGAGFWLTRNTGQVGVRAQSALEFWKSHDAQQVRNQIIGMLDYLDGASFVNIDLPPGTPLQVPQADAHFGLLSVDPQGLVARAESYLKAIAQSPYASTDQKALATRLVAKVNKINAQYELVHQDARMLIQMTDAQLLQPSSLSLVNDMAAHAAYALMGNSKIGLEGAVKVFNDMQSLANFDAEAYQH